MNMEQEDLLKQIASTHLESNSPSVKAADKVYYKTVSASYRPNDKKVNLVSKQVDCEIIKVNQNPTADIRILKNSKIEKDFPKIGRAHV